MLKKTYAKSRGQNRNIKEQLRSRKQTMGLDKAGTARNHLRRMQDSDLQEGTIGADMSAT